MEGLEVRLRPRGLGRFVTAAFLSVWLCGWTAGEGFALYMLYGMARAALTGEPMRGTPRSMAAALAIGGFLLLWVSLWTLGGVMAIRELLRSVWAEDRIVMRPDRVAIARRLGPFRKRYEIPRERIRRAFLQPKKLTLAIETDVGVVEASGLGDPAERMEILEALQREMAIPRVIEDVADAASTTGPPAGWEEIVTPEGEPVLVQSTSIRRTQAQVATGLALLAIVGAAMLIANALHDWALIPGAVIVSAIAGALTWGAVWLVRGRMEWRIGSGSITLRRRFGASVRDVFVAHSLELGMRSDSDGDDWFSLDARSADAPAATALTHLDRKGRRRITQALHDSTVPRRLGRWLSKRAGLPFEDLATEERRAVELAQLRLQLEALLPRMGPLGNVVRGLIARGEARQTGKNSR